MEEVDTMVTHKMDQYECEESEARKAVWKYFENIAKERNIFIQYVDKGGITVIGDEPC